MPTPSASARIIAQRDAVLALSRMLQSAGHGAMQEALDLVLDAIGVQRGAVYELGANGLDAVAHRGLTAGLRGALEHLTIGAGFIVARAAKQRRTLAESNIARTSGDIDADALAEAGWTAAIAAPIAVGREARGAIVVAHQNDEPLSRDAIAFIETIANLLGLARSRKKLAEAEESPRETRAAQLAAVGMLAIGFADDMREPLGALEVQLQEQARVLRELRGIRGSRGARDEGAFELEALDELVDEANAAVARAERTRERLLSCVRDSTPEEVSLGGIARDAIALLSSHLRGRAIQVDARIAVEPVVVGRREELTQLVLQLLLNAADAIAGEEAPRTSARASGGVRRIIVTIAREGTRASLTVEDSGPGIAADVRARLFDAFFTTKQQNLGLGLTFARQVARSHRGHIEIGSSSLGGAEAKLLLPSQRATARPKSQRATPSKAPARDGTADRPAVIWIDDDGLFLRSIKRVLKGWDMRVARSAAEADSILFEAGSSPLRVFCDVGLPDRSGHDLHRSVAARSPELASRFVFVTGGAITAEVADYLVASGCPTLLKPIRVDEVETLLARADTTRPPAGPLAVTVAPAKRMRAPAAAAAKPTSAPEKPRPSAHATKPAMRARRAARVEVEKPAPTLTREERMLRTIPSAPNAKRR